MAGRNWEKKIYEDIIDLLMTKQRTGLSDVSKPLKPGGKNLNYIVFALSKPVLDEPLNKQELTCILNTNALFSLSIYRHNVAMCLLKNCNLFWFCCRCDEIFSNFIYF